MESRPFFTDPMRIALAAAMLFAAASVGYFVAVLFHTDSSANESSSVQKLTIQQKSKAVYDLSVSTDTQGRPSSKLAATATPAQVKADTDRKLKVLQNLNP